MSVPVVKVSVLTTPPSLKLKLLPKPVVQVKMLSRFPANVAAISPVLLDRTGGNYTFSIDLNAIIANLPPAGVSSVFGRSGAVTAQSGDYTFAQIGSTPTTLSGYGITDAQPLDSDLTAIAALTTTSFGRGYLTLADASASRTYLSLVPGTDIQAYDSDLAALAANSTNGLWARTGSGTGAARTITGPVAGITVSNGDGVSGNPTLALANDLSALEGLSSTGIAVRTTTDTWAQRTITGTANAISVTNGDGVSGNPTLAISTDAALPGNPTTTTQAVDNSTTRVATTAYVVGQAAAATPLGSKPTAVVGTSTRFARADHVHPGREVLTANRTYYVRTDGSDSNNGLANTSGGAFLTIQKAIDTVAALDINIYNVTVNVADGTYTGNTSCLGPWLGSGSVTIVGNTTTPANVIINPASGSCFQATGGGFLIVSGMELRGQIGLLSQINSRIYGTTSLRFGAASAYHVYANGGQIILFNSYSIVGASTVHWLADAGGNISATGLTITITGTPAFSNAFVNAGNVGSFVLGYSNTFSGSATGTRYIVQQGALVNSNGGGASYFPGNAAGSGTNFGASPWGLYQ